MKKTIVKYYTKYWLMILLSTAFLVCQALCELQLPTYMSDIITSGIAVGDMDQIAVGRAGMRGLGDLGRLFFVHGGCGARARSAL